MQEKNWMQWATTQLEELAALELGWDSYGANPIAPQALIGATHLLHLVYEQLGGVACPQIIAPRADGGVQIEWGIVPLEIAVHADSSGLLGYLCIDRRDTIPQYREVRDATREEVLQLITIVVHVTH